MSQPAIGRPMASDILRDPLSNISATSDAAFNRSLLSWYEDARGGLHGLNSK